MQPNYSDEQVQLAARLYYTDNFGQSEVARFVGVSQTKVSRLLSLARERGIVQITVADYQPRNLDLEKQLVAEFGLKTAAVIKTAQNIASEDQRRTLAHFGSPFIASLILPNGTVAIAGGRTMRELVDHFPADATRRLTIIQAMGSVDSNVGVVDASELGRAMAQKTGGVFLTINTPAFVPDKMMRDALLNLEQIRFVWHRLSQADTALIGIGTLENSIFVDRGVFSAEDLQKLKAAGAVGEICGRFFDKDGQECSSPWRDRVISVELEQLRKTPQVIAMVAGNDRSMAIAAAIRGGLLKALVIDEAGAKALLGKDSPLTAAKPKSSK
ncbi:MAG: transcriptional regulator [Verrucomicrobiales bacterium]|nr:transcriptional regulator [Verrucomicrobiales bacterium]